MLYRNIENKKLYNTLLLVLNATNGQNYGEMTLYEDVVTHQKYVRKINEFAEKFELVEAKGQY